MCFFNFSNAGFYSIDLSLRNITTFMFVSPEIPIFCWNTTFLLFGIVKFIYLTWFDGLPLVLIWFYCNRHFIVLLDCGLVPLFRFLFFLFFISVTCLLLNLKWVFPRHNNILNNILESQCNFDAFAIH